jgi:hypothetical protein
MTTAKISRLREVETETEIKLPYFCHKDGWYVKVKSEDEAWRITIGAYSGISKASMSAFNSEIGRGEPITEDEFNEKWTEALSAILPKPSEEQG